MYLLVFLCDIRVISLVGVALRLADIVWCRAAGHLTFASCQIILAFMLQCTLKFTMFCVASVNLLSLSLIFKVIFVVYIAHDILLNQLIVIEPLICGVSYEL